MSGPARAANGTWSINGSGNWSDTSKWTSATVASGPSAIADFSSVNITPDVTVTMDAAYTIGTLKVQDATTVSNSWIFAGSNALTLDNGASAPVLNVLTGTGHTISAPLAGTNGFSKTGAGTVILSGTNTISGAVTLPDVASTNSAGVQFSSAAALGGLTSITVVGTGTSGQFCRFQGSGITVPATVSFNLTGQGGNSAPLGTLVGAGTGVNTIQGPITVNTGAVRIANSGASRLDITGAISGGANLVTFRYCDNEGVHLTNTSNSWSGGTSHSQGTLWAEPGTLPAASNLLLTASADGLFQSSGSFTRSVGSGAGQIQWQYVQSGSRISGLGARGGNLAVNLGGAGADLQFMAYAAPTGTTALSSNTVTAITTTGLTVGMTITGTGIPANSTITAIGTNQITLSAVATAAGTVTLTCSQSNVAQINCNSLWLNGAQADSKLILANPLDLNGASRTIQVSANTAELSGGLKASTTLTKTGSGYLLVSGPTILTGTLTIATNTGTTELSGGIQGTAVLTKTGSASLILSGPSTWTTGNLTSGATASNNYGSIRVTHAEALGAPATVRTVQMRGLNQGTSILELANNITIDANKTLNISGKAFYASGSATIGNQVSLRNVSGNNTWAGNVVIAETGGAYGMESVAGTLTIGASSTTTSTLRNTAAASSIRPMSFFGAGDFVLNSKVATNGTYQTTIIHCGSGLLSLTRGDNDFDQAPILNSGSTQVVKLVNSGTASSLGTAASITLGGTLRYVGTGDSSNRSVSLLPKGGTIDASGSGPLNLTSTSLTHNAGSTSQNCAPCAIGASTLTLDNSSSLAVGQTVTGAALAAGTTISAIDVANRTITLNTPTTAAFTNAFVPTLGATADINRTLTLTGTNADSNTLAATLTDVTGGLGKLALTKNGTGKWILPAVNTYTGATTVNGGTLSVTGSLAGAVTVNTGATLALGGSVGNVTVTGGTLAGNGTVNGNLNLSGTLAPDPTLSPALNVTGTLNITGPVFIAPASGMTPGTYPILTFAALTGSTSGFTSGYRTSSFASDFTSASITFGPGIPLIWTGSVNGTWDLNTSANWLDLGYSAQTFRWLDAVTFDSNGSAQPNVNLIGELRSDTVTVNASTVDYTLGGSGTISQGRLTKSGSSMLTVTTSNSYAGGSTLSGGRVRVGSATALGSGPITLAGSGLSSDSATARSLANGLTISANTIFGDATDSGALSVAGNVTLSGTSPVLTTVSQLTLNGVIDGSGLGFTKAGSNTLVLGGSNSYDGATVITSGTVYLGNASALGSNASGTTVQSGAQVNFGNLTNGSTVDEPFDIAGDGGAAGVLHVGSGKAITLSNAITLSAASTIKTDGGAGFTFSNTVTGTDTDLTFAMDGSVVTTVSGNLSLGAGNLIKNSTSRLILNGTDSYASTFINGGTLQIGTQTLTGNLGSGAVTDNGVLLLDRSDAAYTVANDISGSGSITIGQVTGGSVGAVATLTGNNSFAGGITINSGGLKIHNVGALGTGAKTINLTNGTAGRPQLYLDGSAGNLTLPATISFITSSANFTEPAIGNVAGDNVINGNFTLAAGGGSTAISVVGGSLTLNGNIAANTSLRFLLLGGLSGANGTINGVISDGTNPMGVTLSGANVWTLTGNNSYTEATAVTTGGTLVVNGNQSAATGAVNLSSGATLTGVGTLGGAVNNNGTVAPGNGIGTLTTGAFTFGSTGSLVCQINSATLAADVLSINGNLNIDAASTLMVSDIGAGTPASGSKFVLISYTGAWNGVTFAGLGDGTTVTLGANQYLIKYNETISGTNKAVTLTVVGGFSSWAATNAPGQLMNQDHDNDGVANGIEYFMGLTGSGFTANPGVVNGKVSWPKGAQYSGVYGSDYVVQTSTTDMSPASWSDVAAGDSHLSDGKPLEYTLPQGDVKIFVRLKVTGP